ncbi:MAG: hypothetical protein K2L95_01575 [Alphaproteobacteria bacterium]|nr:hypothetical protein [Alphaproteobacteria bacterium]
MKKSTLLSAVSAMAFVGAASAADITLYYSPSCPHCHHAREFISQQLVYEYPTIEVDAVNVMTQENLPLFQEALRKCEYESGGVPVMVIGEKCFQGYADFMQDELREAVAADLSDSQKETAAENKAAMEANADEFRAKNAKRANAVVERSATLEKKSERSNVIYFYGLLVVLVAALGFVLIKKDNKKKK